MSTSDIQKPYGVNAYVAEDLVLRGTTQQGWRIFSLGVIESAIEKGLNVYVVTTRKESQCTNEWDMWWRALVDDDHIFFCDEDERVYDSACRRFFETVLKQPWPKDQDGYDLCWTGAESHAASKDWIRYEGDG